MLKIGVGAGFSGDRIDAAETLVKSVDLDYIIFECLAERTIALAQQRKKEDEQTGYDPLLEKRIRRILPLLIERKVKLITNMGAANPYAGGKKIIEIAEELGISCKVAVVTGDDVLDKLDDNKLTLESETFLKNYQPIRSANAYLGVEALLPALETEADVIITGRVADPSLFLAPQVYHYGWEMDDYKTLGQGTIIGHLLECGCQVSGGYFADTMQKNVPDLANVGMPYADIDENGNAFIKKAENTGGLIDLRTVKEQLLYEVHDPKKYLTPDVTADFTTVHLEEIEENNVLVQGGTGSERPADLKVSVGYQAGYVGVGEISYAGTDALERAEWAKEILQERLENSLAELRIDLVGVSSVHRKAYRDASPYEVRVRAAGRHTHKEVAELVGEEVEALYLNGPSAGGGVRKSVTDSTGIVSTMISRSEINANIQVLESK